MDGGSAHLLYDMAPRCRGVSGCISRGLFRGTHIVPNMALRCKELMQGCSP